MAFSSAAAGLSPNYIISSIPTEIASLDLLIQAACLR
jgi:hypothetical protein